ncbi:MAG: ABC transporter ATP-binding protein [Elusimicrobia bacterium]|nr:ABC transporter ATP-binding protein [Elusimicrobiota bacterium]
MRADTAPSMRSIRRLLPYLKPCRSRLLQACALMLCVAAFNGATPWLLQPIVDQALILKNPGVLNLAAALIPVVFLVKLILLYTQAYLTSYIGQKTAMDLRGDIFRRLHGLSADFYWRHRSGDILSRITNDLNALQSGLQFIPLYAVRDSMTVLVLIGVLFHLHWKFALLALTGGPVAALFLSRLGRKLREAGRQSQGVMGEIYQRFHESLQGMTVIKAFNYEEGAIQRFRRENSAFFGHIMRYLRATALSAPLMEFLGSLILGALLYFGGREILRGTLTPGGFFAFLGCFFSAYSPIKNLAAMNSSLQMSLACADRIFMILDARPTVADVAAPVPFAPPRRGIVFEGVCFRYPEREQDALGRLDWVIEPGEHVGIVGPSGSGKSTLIHLLLRFFDPTQGRILVDGEDLRSFSVRSVRDHIGLVTQEPFLFEGAVGDNVAMGRPRACEKEILEALENADARRFVESLPGGLHASVGERGAKLSGGQRQRIALARAILRDPPILLLDEATSNLDAESEMSIQRAIERLSGKRIILQIAHRLHTIRSADRIIVLSGGKITESGSHQDLMSRRGLYAYLSQLQEIEPA